MSSGRGSWGIAGAVYLVAAVLAFGFTHRIRLDLEERLEAEGSPVDRSGVDRLEELLGEIDATRREEEERPEKVLPYIGRRRAGTGSS